MKIIEKSVRIAYNYFKPNLYQKRYHFAIAFDKSKPICISQNDPIKTNAKAFRMGERFNVQKYTDYPYNHAETYLIFNLLNKFDYINPNWKMVVLRINRSGKLMMSKPCLNCQKILDSVNFKKVYWSIGDGLFSSKKETLSRCFFRGET